MPQKTETAFIAIVLLTVSNKTTSYLVLQRSTHQCGSSYPSCIQFPAGPSFLAIILLLHGMTSATIDITLASGPAAAATSGIAVEAIHQDWGSSSSGGLMWKWLQKRSHSDGCTARSPSGVWSSGDPFCIVCAAQPCAGSSGCGGSGRCKGSGSRGMFSGLLK